MRRPLCEVRPNEVRPNVPRRHSPARISVPPAVWRLLRSLLPAKITSRVQLLDEYAVDDVVSELEEVPAPFGSGDMESGATMLAWMRRQCELQARGL